MKLEHPPRRVLVRWHGGKWLLAPWIIRHFPAHRIYCEPFGGGGSVLIRKMRTYGEIYNDLDGEIVNLFTMVRDRGPELQAKLTMTPFSREEFIAAYQETDDPLERARRLVVKCFQGFGSNSALTAKRSGFRANAARSGTIPAHDWVSYPAALEHTIRRLQGVVIEHRDAKLVMKGADGPETLHYVDPPYLLSTRGDPRPDYKHEMNESDHVELADFLKELKGSVVLSGYPSALYDRLFQSWTRVERRAMANGSRPRVEVLWIKRAGS